MATTNSKTTTTTDMPAHAQKIREQLVSTIRQGQQLSVDGAQTWAKAVASLPAVELPAVAGVPAMPGMDAVTTYAFDLATDLLTAQRDFALQLSSAFVPQKSV
ncbi:MAG TPA: hypothetical protein VIM49_02190 [Dermatophilaceae bacterium]|jgi:hypothetical protein